MNTFKLERMNPFLIFALLILTIVGIGWADYVVGAYYSLFLLYIFPIFASSWLVGRAAGISIALLCSLSWMVVDILLQIVPDRIEYQLFSLLTRLILFIVMAIMISGYRKLFDTLHNQAYHDEKTGAYNYRAFIELSEKEIARSQRHGTGLVLAYFDMDQFKAVNDQYGHLEGDRILTAFSHLVHSQIRTTDLFARIGGDEFLSLFIDVELDQVTEILNRIQSSFSETMSQCQFPVTISIGVTDVFPPGRSMESVVQQADQLMYQAKREGRNKICTSKNSSASSL